MWKKEETDIGIFETEPIFLRRMSNITLQDFEMQLSNL